MVFFHNKILNGFNDFLCYDMVNMPTDWYKLCLSKSKRHRFIHNGYTTTQEENPDFEPPPTCIADFLDEVESFDTTSVNYKYRNDMFLQTIGIDTICDYLGIVPFYDSIMLNISPNWNLEGLEGIEGKCQIEFLKLIIDKFLDSPRFTKYKYVIECGKSGNHIHAHCVIELNNNMKKSNKTWISKGNHLRDLRTIWNKLNNECDGGYGDCIKSRHALQCILIKNKDMLKDKLDYCIEEMKPLSHQNAQHPHLPQVFSNGF